MKTLILLLLLSSCVTSNGYKSDNRNWYWLAHFKGVEPSGKHGFIYEKYRSMFICTGRVCRVAYLRKNNYDWFATEFRKDFGREFPFKKIK